MWWHPWAHQKRDTILTNPHSCSQQTLDLSNKHLHTIKILRFYLGGGRGIHVVGSLGPPRTPLPSSSGTSNQSPQPYHNHTTNTIKPWRWTWYPCSRVFRATKLRCADLCLCLPKLALKIHHLVLTTERMRESE